MEEKVKKTKFFVKHWVAALAIAVLLVLVGVVSLLSLSIEQYPDIAPPEVVIQANYSGADAGTVLKSVIMPIEEKVNGVEDMMYMSSTALSNGSAEIDVYFKQGTDADQATVNVQNRVSQAEGILPADVTTQGVTVSKSVNSILQVLALESTDDKFDQKFIANYIDINVLPVLSRITGVGTTQLLADQYGVRIWLKPNVMGMYGVTTNEIISCINEQNLVAPVGSFESTVNKIDIEFNGLLDDMSEFENIVIRSTSDGNVLRLKDVADVELGSKSYNYRSNVEGHPGVCFLIKQAPGANATQVNAQIDKTIEELSKSLPAGLEFKQLQTSDNFLYASMHNVIETLIIAIILVILIVYFFLQDFKATIVPSISIIVSLIGTFAIAKVAGFSLNLLTLFALVLAIGIVVDDAVVVVEAVMAKLESGYKSATAAVNDALTDVSTACISTALVFMAVFIPVTFMSGTSGTFFKQFGTILAASVALSAVSALTICPALCALLFKPKNENEAEKKNLNYYVRVAYNAAYGTMEKRYISGISKFVKKPAFAWILLVAFTVGMVWLMSTAQSELVPQEDQGFMMVDVTLAPGTYLNETEEAVTKLEDYIRTLDDVELVSGVTGISMINGGAGSNYGTLMVRLKNWEERKFFSVAAVQKKIYVWAMVNMPEATVSPFQMPQIPGYGTGSMMELDLQDRSGTNDNETFVSLCSEFAEKLRERPEVSTASASYSADYPKYHLDIDAAACKRKGVSPQTVLSTLGSTISKKYIGNYIQYGKVYQVLVQAEDNSRMDPGALNKIFVEANGGMTPISEFVTLKQGLGSSQERRFNMYNCYNMSVNPASGYTSAHVRTAVDELMAEVFPDNYGYEYGGMAREEAASAGSNDTIIIYGIAILIIYLILACLYNSVFIPFAVLFSIPFGLFGAYLAVRPLESLMGVGANVYVQIGVIMLMGLVAKTAILITEYAIQNREKGMTIVDAAVEACKARLRPILMTVAAMVIGMIPLAVESGAGAVGNKSLSFTVIGGMLVGIVAILFVTPAFYIVFQKIHEKLTPGEKEETDNTEPVAVINE
ncbi:MAG: efflux RND transporter permease subunit [Bacteroidales bacterium]|nr:efflux RND transporter permease subunit [Bacteroidales bacterium]